MFLLLLIIMPTMVLLEDSTHKRLRRLVLKEKETNKKAKNDFVISKGLKCLEGKK